MELGLQVAFLILFVLCTLVALEDAIKEKPVLGEEWDFTKPHKTRKAQHEI
jgi:hypothetical protein